jgi:DNA repair photolyase
MIRRLSELEPFVYYFQFTLTSYENDIEGKFPRKDEVADSFLRLSEKIGSKRVVWRYDPILLNEKYTVDLHIERFGQIAKKLVGATEKVVISFLDFYPKIRKRIEPLNIRESTVDEKDQIAKALSKIASEHGMKVESCSEAIDLGQYGIEHGRCVDDRLINAILKERGEVPICIGKDKNQRLECGCVFSIDIGAYNTCGNGCRYCYANFNETAVATNCKKHNPDSPLFVGEVPDEAIVKLREAVSYKESQIRFDT